MEIKKILWPSDLSGRAQHALNYVQSLTERYDAEIHVLYVITDLAHHRGLYGNFTQDHIDKIIAWENKKAKERLDEGGTAPAGDAEASDDSAEDSGEEE